MSFDLFLVHFQQGQTATLDRQAFLGEVLRQNLVRETGSSFYHRSFADGSSLELNVRNLETPGDCTGCAFHLHALSQGVLESVFELASASELVIFFPLAQADEPPLAILSRPAQATEMANPERFRLEVVRTWAHLGELLSPGYDSARAYAQAVTRPDSSRT